MQSGAFTTTTTITITSLKTFTRLKILSWPKVKSSRTRIKGIGCECFNNVTIFSKLNLQLQQQHQRLNTVKDYIWLKQNQESDHAIKIKSRLNAPAMLHLQQQQRQLLLHGENPKS